MTVATRIQGSAEAVGQGASCTCTTDVHVPHWTSEDQSAKITVFSLLTI